MQVINWDSVLLEKLIDLLDVATELRMLFLLSSLVLNLIDSFGNIHLENCHG